MCDLQTYRTIVEALERCKTLIEFEIFDDSTDLQELIDVVNDCGFNLRNLESNDGFDYENVFDAVENILGEFL